jgi:hypothetical protein
MIAIAEPCVNDVPQRMVEQERRFVVRALVILAAFSED